MTALSAHFTLAELTVTETGLPNRPDATIAARLKITAEGMERVRAVLGGKPIRINSGYRSPAVNRKVKGSPTSGHMLGWCADFVCPAFGAPIDICRALVAAGIRFDQLIEEGTWVHISFDPRMRGQVKTKRPGQPYRAGLRG